jgi:hypothetical protein
MKKLFAFIFLTLVIYSCNKDETNVLPYTFDVYRTDFMTYYSMGGSIGDTNKVLLEYYPDGKLKKRTGDIIAVPVPPYPYPYSYCDCVADTFIYTANKTEVYRYMKNGGENLLVQTTTYLIDNDRINMITASRTNSNYTTDTTFLFYNTSGIIDSSLTYRYHENDLRRRLKKSFSFDGDGNLVKVEGEDMSNYRTEEYFSGYDQEENPLKNLTGLEDVFYRTLSKNNFTDYTFKRIYYSSQPYDWSEKHWDFEYDGNGLPLFN